MRKKYHTKQEEFWAGSFGDQYTARNTNVKIIAANTALFAAIFSHASGVASVIELGAGSGNNLCAVAQLLPSCALSAVEINDKAVFELKKIKGIKIHHASLLNFSSTIRYDFVLVKGVLIHQPPKELQKIYQLMYELTNKYICLVEYYNPTPVGINYRGHAGFLFKRDFAGEVLDKFKDLHLVKYGFTYHRDNNFPQDDLTWFLLERRS
jgi:spore coat polysaccharide biosynthesis protein SpsF